jgi:hypothetical protein
MQLARNLFKVAQIRWEHRKTLAVGPSNSVPNRRSTHTSARRGRGFQTPENTPADKHRKTLGADPWPRRSICTRRWKRFQTKDRCQRKSIARQSQSGHQIRRQIDRALALAEGGALRQQKIRQPKENARHSQPRHRISYHDETFSMCAQTRQDHAR